MRGRYNDDNFPSRGGFRGSRGDGNFRGNRGGNFGNNDRYPRE